MIREIETEWVPLSDGRRLAARLFLPDEAERSPVPVVLEYIPYRRRDGTRLGDESMHRWFAQHGLAAARVDISGTGDSDGLLDDEYVRREQDDGLEVIAWLAAQPWSNGSVAMIGISWGGFNGLQIAARRPPALRTVISVCSTVDRYHGDVHYSGGCLNEENLEWGAYLFAMHAFPPDPAIVGDRWRDMWRSRIESAILPPARWLEHQVRDDFWRHGSVVEDLTAIEVPVLAVSGWADGYTETVFDLVEGLDPATVGIVGPWGHRYPHEGIPGPAIDFLSHATDWFHRWMSPGGVAPGESAPAPAPVPAPAMRLWVQDSMPPAAHHDRRPGRWLEFAEWPSSQIDGIEWSLTGDELVVGGAGGETGSDLHRVCSPVTTGRAGGQWCAYGLGKISPELPTDQRGDDAGSATWDSATLPDSLVLIGRPEARLRVALDHPIGHLAVRLCAVAPDGASERLGYGLLNLTHLEGHDRVVAIEPGAWCDVVVPLTAMAHQVPAGHRLRVAVSTAYWPMIWPSPDRVTATIDAAGSFLTLPTLTNPDSATIGSFGPAESSTSGSTTTVEPGREDRWVTEHLASGITELVAYRDDGTFVLDDIGTELSFRRIRSSSIAVDDPLSATVNIEIRATYRRDEWDVGIDADVQMSCTADSFILRATLHARDGNDTFADRSFDLSIPRHGV